MSWPQPCTKKSARVADFFCPAQTAAAGVDMKKKSCSRWMDKRLSPIWLDI